MTQLRSIEIDFAVHQFIEKHRESFEDSPNDVLRRVLLKESPQKQAPASKPGSVPFMRAKRDWFGGGVRLPDGTELRMEYNGQRHTGQIVSGRWQVEGSSYKSPSGAANAVARTRDGKATSINGKLYWEVKRPGDEQWIPFKLLESERRHGTA